MKSSRFQAVTRTFWRIIDKFVRDNITLYSAQTAYFVVVSLIPFAIILIPVISILIPDNTFQLLHDVVLMLPGSLGEIAEHVLRILFRMPDTSIISFYALLSLWAASKGIMSLQTGLHGIYHIKETENYFVRRGRCMLYTLVFLLAIAIALVLLVMGGQLDKLLIENFSALARLAKVMLAFRTLITLAIFVAAFTGGYQYLAGSGCTFWEALPGVLITTISWMIFSWLYSLYIAYLSRYITLYGSLGALIFLFLWLYFCIVILMIGAEFNVYLADRRERRRQLKKLQPEKEPEKNRPAEDPASEYREDD